MGFVTIKTKEFRPFVEVAYANLNWLTGLVRRRTDNCAGDPDEQKKQKNKRMKINL
jgi:hypothetical protein